MSTYDWPSDLGIESMDWGIDRAVVQLTSSVTRAVQSVDLLGYQWVVQVTLPPETFDDAARTEAFLNTLVGGAERVRLHRRDRPVPRGTLRGAPTLASAVAQFSDQLVLANAWDTSRQNLLRRSQEIDTAGVWELADATVTPNGATAPDGTVTADIVNLSPVANARVDQTSGVAAVAGATYTYSVWLRGSGVARIEVNSNLGTGGGTYNLANLTGTWQRFTVTHTFTAGATGNVRVHGVIRRVDDTATAVAMWGAQLEVGGVATAYIPTTSVAAYAPVTLLAGDMLGVGSQLFQARADAVSDTVGQMVVQVVNRTRSSLATGTAVIWDRPKATFVMEDTSSAFTFAKCHIAGATFKFIEAR